MPRPKAMMKRGKHVVRSKRYKVRIKKDGEEEEEEEVEVTVDDKAEGTEA